MGISVLQWNANGLLMRQSEFKQHLANNEYDVICIQETFLKPDKQFYLAGYDIIRRDRDSPKGGLMMLLKHGVKYLPLPDLPNIECQTVEIATKSGGLIIVHVYVSPTTEIDVNSYQNLFSRPNTIIVGEFNANYKLWNSTKENARGRVIEQLLIQNNYVALNTSQPTYQNIRGQVSHIDLTLVSSVLATKCSWHTKNNTMGSDHMPILCHVDDHPYVETASPPKWKLDKADWKLYKEGCKNYIHTLLVYDDDIDTFNKNIINMVNTASGSSIPRRKSSKKTKHNPLPYWNDRIRKAVYDRNCARNKMNRTKTQENIEGYKRAKGIAQHIIKDSAVTYWQNYCNTIDSSTRLGTVWNMAKRMNGIQCNIANKHLIGTNGQVIESNADKAELLAQKFSVVSRTNNYSEKFRQQKCTV